MTSYTPPTFTLGRFFLTLNSIISIAAPYIADFNHTHVYNPNWPPHARFHNGQTMSMGVALGLLTLYLAYRPSSSSSTVKPSAQLEIESSDVFAAALAGSLYWVTGLSAILYPGAAAQDPEFGPIDEFPQFWVFLFTAGLAWVGWGLEGWRISGLRNRLMEEKGR